MFTENKDGKGWLQKNVGTKLFIASLFSIK